MHAGVVIYGRRTFMKLTTCLPSQRYLNLSSAWWKVYFDRKAQRKYKLGKKPRSYLQEACLCLHLFPTKFFQNKSLLKLVKAWLHLSRLLKCFYFCLTQMTNKAYANNMCPIKTIFLLNANVNVTFVDVYYIKVANRTLERVVLINFECF